MTKSPQIIKNRLEAMPVNRVKEEQVRSAMRVLDRYRKRKLLKLRVTG